MVHYAMNVAAIYTINVYWEKQQQQHRETKQPIPNQQREKEKEMM